MTQYLALRWTQDFGFQPQPISGTLHLGGYGSEWSVTLLLSQSMKNEFLHRLEKTTLTDLFGRGENLRLSILEILRKYPQDQADENFRKLMREVLETESGVTGEELVKEKSGK